MNLHNKIYEKENLTHDCVLSYVEQDGDVVSFLDKSDIPIPEAVYDKMTELTRKWVASKG